MFYTAGGKENYFCDLGNYLARSRMAYRCPLQPERSQGLSPHFSLLLLTPVRILTLLVR
jgi:hypothetical protein